MNNEGILLGRTICSKCGTLLFDKLFMRYPDKRANMPWFEVKCDCGRILRIDNGNPEGGIGRTGEALDFGPTESKDGRR